MNAFSLGICFQLSVWQQVLMRWFEELAAPCTILLTSVNAGSRQEPKLKQTDGLQHLPAGKTSLSHWQQGREGADSRMQESTTPAGIGLMFSWSPLDSMGLVAWV